MYSYDFRSASRLLWGLHSIDFNASHDMGFIESQLHSQLPVAMGMSLGDSFLLSRWKSKLGGPFRSLQSGCVAVNPPVKVVYCKIA